METKNNVVLPVALPNGTEVPSRIAMAPMVTWGSEKQGQVADEDIAYFKARAGVAGLIITGAATVSANGRGWDHQISIEDDDKIPGLTRLAAAMKEGGNKALVQLHHAGRESVAAGQSLGYTVAPSAVEFPWLDVQPRELTTEEITAIITDFGAATQRAIDAGFDGVEIHGANHYLLQQFFSVTANHRDDEWGGDLGRRMAFPLAVLKEVKRVVAEAGRPDFIVGYRVCPQERHGDVIGYPLEDCLELVDAIADEGVDYLHTSLFMGFDEEAPGSQESLNQRVHKRLAGRAPLIVVSDVHTADDVTAALDHGDIVAIGRSALIEPEFAAKLIAGRGAEIETSIEGRLDDLAWPAGLKYQYTTGPMRTALPPIKGLNA